MWITRRKGRVGKRFAIRTLRIPVKRIQNAEKSKQTARKLL